MTAYFGLIDVGKVEGGRRRGRQRRRRRDRLDGRADRQDQGRRQGHRHRRRSARSAHGSSTSWASTRRSTTRPTTSPRACARPRPTASTCTSTTSAARSSTRASAQLALRGRIVLCGAISAYNDRGAADGPANYAQPDRQARAHGGLHDPRLLRPLRRGAAPRSPAGWPKARSSRPSTSSRAWRTRPTRSTCCSPAATPARSSSQV